MEKHVNLDIMQFVEQQILPRYVAFGRSHGLAHVQRVIKKSLELGKAFGANLNMVYVISAYHDLGMEGPRAIHHITGGKILAADARLRKWFSADQIGIMKAAIEDHRASASHAPRSIYGKIVAEADRELESNVVFARAIEYGFEHYPKFDKEKQWQRFNNHMEEKYSVHGYIRLWLPNSPCERELKKIRDIISDKRQLRQIFDQIYNSKNAKSVKD